MAFSLLHDVSDMNLDRVLRQVELARDPLVRSAPLQRGQNVQLAGCEMGGLVTGCGPIHGADLGRDWGHGAKGDGSGDGDERCPSDGVGGREELGREAERIVDPAGQHEADCRYGDPERIGDREDSTRTRLDGLEGKALAPAADDDNRRSRQMLLEDFDALARSCPGVYGLATLSNPSATGMLIAGLISPTSATAITSVLENAACRTSAKHSPGSGSGSTQSQNLIMNLCLIG